MALDGARFHAIPTKARRHVVVAQALGIEPVLERVIVGQQSLMRSKEWPMIYLPVEQKTDERPPGSKNQAATSRQATSDDEDQIGSDDESRMSLDGVNNEEHHVDSGDEYHVDTDDDEYHSDSDEHHIDSADEYQLDSDDEH